MHRHPRNLLQHSRTPFKCTKITVLNIGGTLSYLFLKSTNEKSTTVRLLNFLADFFTVNMKLQQTNSYVTVRYRHLGKTKSTPTYLSKMSNIKILNFCDFLCPNLLQWMLLIKQMHRLLRNMLQHSPIPFRCKKSRVLDFGGTPSYLFFKSTN